ncbi:protocadherin Fat 2 [Spea bombifrons]|uniref:protocadherin Fat 2 n=1 Tax=Spea bombifrons TaxID=233779 RepID=UPI0023491A4F|nr:protocadherin Fat 2 [Spea bombifrons]
MVSFTYLEILSLTLFVAHYTAAQGNPSHDNAPLLNFTQNVYHTTIYENSAPKTYVVSREKMGIYLKDPEWSIKYRIISGDSTGLFKTEELVVGDFCFLRIRMRSGNTALLNREVKDNYQLIIRASEKSLQHEVQTKVIIQILDMNDLRPLFSTTSYRFTVNEEAPLKTVIGKISATDADLGQNAMFYYTFNTKSPFFSIHPTSGLVMLVQRLNATEIAVHRLQILAVDRMKKISEGNGFGNVASLEVLVQPALKKPPLISSVTTAIPDSSDQLLYATVSMDLADPGCSIDSVDIVAGDPLGYFKVARSYVGKNEFTVVSTAQINWLENPQGFNLSLRAKDKSKPPVYSPVQTIHIPPWRYAQARFEQDVYKVQLNECSPPGTYVTLVKTVPVVPTGGYHFRIPTDKFKIITQTGLIITSRQMDIKDQSQFQLEVTALNGHIFTTVLVDLVDCNNHAPVFTRSSFHGSFNENSPIGTKVLQVSATDADLEDNGKVTYTLVSPKNAPFSIDKFSGVITSNRILDYELTQRMYRLRVWASDWGSPFQKQSEVYVSIILNNLNDNSPMFEKVNCNISIPRDLPIGEKVVALSAVDIDELQNIQYEIISGNDLQKFKIEPTSGIITVRGEFYGPQHPKLSFYSLAVTARDGENDAEPTIVNITISNEGSPVSVQCEDTGVLNKIAANMIDSFQFHSEDQDLEEDTPFNIHIINSHTPLFDDSFPISIDVLENTPVDSSIVQLTAIDLDTGLNGQLVYVISEGNEDGCFSMNMENGNLIVSSPLDRETTSSYILNITVYDLGIPQRSSWKILAVNLLDVNDNAPYFPPPGYCVTILEDTKVGSLVLKVKADDHDMDDNGRVTYTLLTATDKFTVDSMTGELTVKGLLDRELMPKYKLKIEARDQPKGDHQLISTTDVLVTLEDVNDNAPYCRPVTANVKIPEDIPLGTVVYFVDATDPDVGQNGEVSYTLISDEQGIFRVEKLTGALIIEKELDYEKRSFYNLTIRATDAGLPFPHSSVCHVEVDVLDVNENLQAPNFQSFVFHGSLPESSPPGTPVLSITAQDGDKGKDGDIRYSIRDGTDLSVFSIDEETGTIRTEAPLDRESVSSYWLTIYATDLGSVPLFSVAEVYIEVIDVNDNIPQMSKAVFYASVMENSPSNVSVLQLEASDADSAGKLYFFFSNGNNQGFFMLNPYTGLITTTAQQLDRESKEEHILEVTVSDNGTPPLQSISRVVIQVLDVNDNPPTFSQKLFTIQLPERESSEEPVSIYRLIAMDRDKGINSQVTYSITESTGDMFSIHPSTGVISSKASFPAGEYTILTVKASDSGSPSRSSTVRLHVQWIQTPEPSDEPLVFDEPHFSFQVMETDPVNHMVGLISTEFISSEIWFQITGGDEDLEFDIDKSTGGLVIARPLQASKKPAYTLTVQVTDGTNTVSTQVHISVVPLNRHRPEFLQSHYEIEVSEDMQLGVEVLKISATDKDSGSRLIYTIKGSADPRSSKMFRLDPSTGILYTTETLDYESMPLHILTVMVRDQDVPIKRNFARVTIRVQDSNDHSPHFIRSLYEVNLPDSSPAGKEVVQVRATDKDQGDNAKIEYFIHSGNTEGYFAVDKSSGVITLRKPMEQPSKNRFSMIITATDQGTPELQDMATVNVHVRSSDTSPPKFTSLEYVVELSESVPIGTYVTLVSSNSWSSINYEIREGNTDDAFYINCYSGIISTQKKLDFETMSSYQLKVRGNSSLGHASETTVFIYIIDENDNPPIFSQPLYVGQISEDAIIGSMVTHLDLNPLVIQATDNDTEANAILTYQILDPEVLKYFKINPSTGTISTVAELDYELYTTYHFRVYVHDGGSPSLFASKPAKVSIQVTDVNDSTPKFLKDTYEFNIYLPAYKGMEILTVTAKDQDSEVSYSISEGNMDNVFSVDQISGVVTVNNASALQTPRVLSIKAWDGFYYDTTTVKINVTKTQETSLKCGTKDYTAEVIENDTSVKFLEMVDVFGVQLNEPVSFAILTYMDLFQIGSSSGVLQTKGLPFDREEQNKYEVIIEIRDSRKPPRIAQCKVEVYVEDINDNAPEFINTPYYTPVEDGLEPGDVIFQVSAIDKDAGRNSAIQYWLMEDYKYFRIDPKLGDIILKQPFDYEALNQYVLRVGAKDNGLPFLQVEQEVVVIVRNKSHPTFQSLYYTVTVPEDVPIYTPILHIQARSPEGFRVIYNIVENEALVLFSIDFKTGALSTAGQLDYESKAKHTLTVRATDTALGFYSEARVLINVEDVNDHPPTFSKMVYFSNVIEKLPPYKKVIQVQASDQDSGKNQEVSYYIVGNSTNGTHDFFHIDSKTGEITTTQELDYELRNQFQFKVRAIDNGLPPLHTDALVIINVSDVNDNPPEFRQLQYKTNVSELANCGHIVIKVQAVDKDSIDAGKLNYFILSGNNHRHFTINKTSGIISLSNLCRNSFDLSYHLQVSASDGVYRATVPVYINITHANKHSPSFQQDMYEVELAENAEIGTKVIEVLALDPDDGPYGTVNYTIINRLASDKFSIDDKGHITTLMKLDRENATERVIAIKVMGQDGGGRAAFCTIKIILTDENDNPPQFTATQYTLSVQSNLSKGTPIIQVVAYDPDEGPNADVTYSVETSDDDLVHINPSNGVIMAKDSLLGLENQVIAFTVIAKDSAPPHWSSIVPVHLQIVPTETPLPRFSEPLYSFTAPEDLPTGSEIGLVKAMAVEPVIYSLVEGTTPESNKDGVFTLDKHTGALTVKKGVDHEKTKWYLIDVQANCPHLGKELVSLVSVSIHVKDINDNKPVFEADVYRTTLTENMPAGTTVIQVTANDQDTGNDGMVTYSLKAETGEIHQLFTIDSENGWISTLRELDCEKQNVYQFYVVASDQGRKIRLSSEVLVEVTVTDENDNPPCFTSHVYKGSVAENNPAGQIIATLRTWDNDISESNRKVTCYITDGDPLGQFSINEVGDQWIISSKKPLDREETEKHLLKVTASDGKFQATSEVEITVLDINDNSPQCQQIRYTATVSEDALPGLFILKISAKDPDVGNNAQILYTLHGLGDNQFRLDPHTGELTTLAPLDREEKASYNLVAKATDGGGLSCQVDITLNLEDVNDNGPVFSMTHYAVTVFDNTTVKTPIAVIFARDPDEGSNSEVLYSLSNSANGLFSIEETTGVTRLEKPLEDIEDTVIDLTTCATDRGSPRPLSTCTTITVSVVALSYYRSVFGSPEKVIVVPEDKAVGSILMDLLELIEDNDDNLMLKYEILNGNEDGIFRLTPDTGILSLNGNLDYEVHQQYFLSVEGTRSSFPPLSDVTVVVINVTDVNDNEPIFNQEGYEAEISEDSVVGDLVLVVSAVDQDGPSNNKVTYTIVKGDPLGHFSIHPERGEIRVLSILDREKTSAYSVVVRATDNGVPAHITEVTARIQVSDVNDNKPIFLQSNYTLVVQDGSPIGTSLTKFIVTDRDSPRHGPPFRFQILSGNDREIFHVSSDGLLSTTSVLSRSLKEKYQLQVQVSDSGIPHLSSTTFATIQVIDRSRYAPSVVPLEIYITTSEAAFQGSVLGKLHATDRDPHDTLMYSLAEEELKRGLFSVGISDGKVIALESLRQGDYYFNVTVSDGTFSSTAPVHIYVWCFSEEELEKSLVLRFLNVAPEEFIGDHWRSLQRFLGNLLKVDRQQIQMASLQNDEESSALDILLVAGTAKTSLYSPQDLADRIAGSSHELGQSVGLQIKKMFHLPCQGLQCKSRTCKEIIELDSSVLSSYSTARISVITPRHTLQQVCTCNNSAMRFDGQSFLQYHHDGDSNVKVQFRLKTHQSHSVLAFSNGTATTMLELVNGSLRFKYQCKDTIVQEIVSDVPVNNGDWHNILLEWTGSSAQLHVNGVATEKPIQPCAAQLSQQSMFIGVLMSESEHMSQGFQGCLDDIRINGQASSSLGHLLKEKGITQCCEQRQACSQEPCHGGSFCAEIQNGGYSCFCRSPFPGPACDMGANPCASSPCLHGRICTPTSNGYTCSCPPVYEGDRCQGAMIHCIDGSCPCVPTGTCNCSDVHGGRQCAGLVTPERNNKSFLVSGTQEIVEILGGVLAVLFLVGLFVAFRKRVCRGFGSHKPAPQEDPDIKPYLSRDIGVGTQVPPMELNILSPSARAQLDAEGQARRNQVPELLTFCKPQGHRGPAICSVAPNLPPAPPSNSDNESIAKNNWECEESMFTGDGTYWSSSYIPAELQGYPPYEPVHNAERLAPPVPPLPKEPEEERLFGGFPFPLEPSNKRAPLPPCYNNRNLDDFLPPPSHCQDQYTAISYYPAQLIQPEGLSYQQDEGYRRLNVRLSVAQPSYADCGPLPMPNSNYQAPELAESDYGSCEEVMF